MKSSQRWIYNGLNNEEFEEKYQRWSLCSQWLNMNACEEFLGLSNCIQVGILLLTIVFRAYIGYRESQDKTSCYSMSNMIKRPDILHKTVQWTGSDGC